MNDKQKIMNSFLKELQTYCVTPLSGYHATAIIDCGYKIFGGVNMEFNTRSETIHAEQYAIARFLNSNDPNLVIKALYTNTVPCGMCRQLMFEYLPHDTPVYTLRNDEVVLCSTVGNLLPGAFMRPVYPDNKVVTLHGKKGNFDRSFEGKEIRSCSHNAGLSAQQVALINLHAAGYELC